MRPASHTNALGELFIAWGREKVQAQSDYFGEMFTGRVRERTPRKDLSRSVKWPDDAELRQSDLHGVWADDVLAR